MASLIFVLLAFLTPFATASEQNPIRKVIEMLMNMKASGVKESEVEHQVFEEYSKFVRDRTSDLKYEVKTQAAKADKFSAALATADSKAEVLTNKLKQLDIEMSSLEADRKSAVSMRSAEHETFVAQQTDYSDSLYAIDKALQVLKSQQYDRPQAMLMLQKAAQETPGLRSVLAELALQESHGDGLVALNAEKPSGTPAVAAYKFQSNSVIDLLEQLQLRFRDELAELDKEEMNSVHAHAMTLVDIGDTLANLKSEHDNSAAAKANAVQASAYAKSQIRDAEVELTQAKALLAEMNATFESKQAVFLKNQQVRSDELGALEKAIQILSGTEVAGAYEKHVKVLVQMPSSPATASFLQLRKMSSSLVAATRARTYLARRATVLGSTTLKMLVAQVANSPFDKVIKMIEELLVRLKQDAVSEADHKAYCDEELKKNKMTRDVLSNEVSRLRGEAASKGAAIEEMTADIARLAAEQADLHKALSEATEQRRKEEAANVVAIKDAQNAQVALKQAIQVLQVFYDSQGSTLAQLKEVPEMEAYQGMQGKNKGIAALLEVIESDFARVESETQSAEVVATEEFTTFTKDTENSLKTKHDSEFQMSLNKDQTEFEKDQLEKDLSSTGSQLDSAQAYYQELKPQCVNVNVSFGERSARRKEEIEALKQAYKILNGSGSD